MQAPARVRRSRDKTCVELSIRTFRWAGCASGGFLLLCLIRAWQLERHGALLPAAMVALGGAAIAWGLWRLRSGGVRPRRLQLHAAGRIVLLADEGPEEAWLAPCSLWIGRHVLLVLGRPGRRPIRLLLGPGILSAQEHAALCRWLHRGSGGEGTAPGVLR